MTTLIQAGILATAALSCGYDVRQRRIPNGLTLGSAAVAIGVYAATAGLGGVRFSATGWVMGLLLFLPWFLLKGMGGGDVKLLAAFGAWLGPGLTLRACLFAMLAGGVMALWVVLRQGRFWPTMAGVVTLAAKGRLDGTQVTGEAEGRSATNGIAYAVPMAAGVWLALWLH